MKLQYNKVQLNRMLLFSIAFNVIGIISLFTNPIRSLLGGFIGIGLLYIVMYVHMRKNQYATINADAITKHIFPVQKIYLEDISELKKFAGDFIIIAGKREMILSSDVMDEESLAAFDSFWTEFTKR